MSQLERWRFVFGAIFVMQLGVASGGAARAFNDFAFSASIQPPDCGRSQNDLSMTADLRTALSLSVTTTQGVYETGEAVVFTITIVNQTGEPVTIPTHTGIYDLTIMASNGGLVFRRPVPLEQVYCTFQPGQIIELPYSIATMLKPGLYTVKVSIRNGPEAIVQFTVVLGGRKEQQALVPGCNNVTVTWPNGISAAVIADAITPHAGLLALWRYDARSATFHAWSPLPGAPNDLTTLNRLDAVFICMREPGTLTRPIV